MKSTRSSEIPRKHDPQTPHHNPQGMQPVISFVCFSFSLSKLLPPPSPLPVFVRVYLFLRHFIHSFLCPLNFRLSISLSLRMTTTWIAVYSRMISKDSLTHFVPEWLYVSRHFSLLKPSGHYMYHQFNIHKLYALPTLYLCVLCGSENKQRLVPLTA